MPARHQVVQLDFVGQLDVDALGVVAHEVEVVLHQDVAQRLGLVLLVLDPDFLDVALGGPLRALLAVVVPVRRARAAVRWHVPPAVGVTHGRRDFYLSACAAGSVLGPSPISLVGRRFRLVGGEVLVEHSAAPSRR